MVEVRESAAPSSQRLAYVCLLAMMAWLLFDAVRGVGVILHAQPAGVDFLPVWSAAKISGEQPERLYDFRFITQLQDWLITPADPEGRPFVYPPSALLVFAPFAGLPFAWANGLWVGLTAALLLAVMAAASPNRRMATAMLAVTPGFIVALIAGQTTFLISALTTFGVWGLARRPILAGIALGVAAAIKPSVLLLAPICLLAGKEYRALASAIAAGAVVGLVSVAVYGVQPWLSWLAALPRFQSLVLPDLDMARNMITPTALMVRLGVHVAALHLVQSVCAVIAIGLAILTFRRTTAWTHRAVVMFGGALLISPYAMSYESTLLAPAIVAIAAAAMTQARWHLGLILYMLVAIASRAAIGPFALVGLLGLIGASVVLARSASVLNLTGAAAGPAPETPPAQPSLHLGRSG